ncbi:MAG: hypothetical protein AAB613_01265 [Patescibacteria group bacterium]
MPHSTSQLTVGITERRVYRLPDDTEITVVSGYAEAGAIIDGVDAADHIKIVGINISGKRNGKSLGVFPSTHTEESALAYLEGIHNLMTFLSVGKEPPETLSGF